MPDPKPRSFDALEIGADRGSATVELDNGAVVRGIIAGRMMKHRIRVVAGDKVLVDMT
jgi:translation initiation factor IF-1